MIEKIDAKGNTENDIDKICSKQSSGVETRIQKRKRDENNSNGKRDENRYMLRNKLTSNTVVTGARKQPQIDNNLAAKDNNRIAQTISKPKRKANLQLQERIQNEVPSKKYLPNEIILATIPGYAAWPAKILDMIGQTVFVEFFGTGQRNLVRPSSIRHFDIKTVLPLLNRKGYKKAMAELEMCLNIPLSLSVLS